MGGIFHSWDGTVLTITSDSGTTAANLKGEKGDMGPRGAQGAKGECAKTDEELAAVVGNYMEEHLPAGETYMLDKTLTVEGYAADAKAVGEAINKITKMEDEVSGSEVLLTASADGYAIDFALDGKSEQKQYTGKNELENTATSQTVNGVKFTVNEDKSVTASGTATANTYLWIGTIVTQANTYICSIGFMGNANVTSSIYLNDTWKGFNGQGGIEEFSIDCSENDALKFGLYVGANQTVNTTFYPMIRKASITDSTYEPYVGGTAAPSPDYPQDIVSVGDKGYFDGELLQGIYSTTGSITSSSGRVSAKNLIPCNEGDVVKFTYEESARLIIAYFKNGTYVSQVDVSDATEVTYTVASDITHIGVTVIKDGITPATAKKIVVTINGMYAAIVKSRGKNELNNTAISKTVNGITWIVNDDKSVTANGTCTSTTYLTLGTLQSVVGKQYTLNGCPDGGKAGETYAFYVNWTKNGAYNQTVDIGSSKTTPVFDEVLTLTSNVIIYAGCTVNNLTFYPMIRFAEVVDDTYEPYQEKTTFISLTEPLRSVGDVKDEIVCQDGVYGVNRKIGKVVIDENSTIALSEYQGYNRFSVVLASTYASVSPYNEGFCSHMTYSKTVLGASTDDNVLSVYTANNGTSVRAYFRMDKFTTVDELKTWLADNPITVYFELAAKTFEAFEDQEPFYKIVTYKPVTYITNSDDTNMSIKYYIDTKTYIDNKFAELSTAIVAMGANV